jgi:hypothetical protein
MTENRAAVSIDWSVFDAPDDVLFDVDFLGIPSGVTTGFVWDGTSENLRDMFVFLGDLAFEVKAAFAYSMVAQDGSGKVGNVWVMRANEHTQMRFEVGSVVEVVLEHDPFLKAIRKV